MRPKHCCDEHVLRRSANSSSFESKRDSSAKASGMVSSRRDWTKLFEGRSQVLLRPQTQQQVSQVRSASPLSCRASGWPGGGRPGGQRMGSKQPLPLRDYQG